mmetsp:Transcript_14049/g.26868  ORF Transcript_14049/g.26868 Transcript_14049/m.26868 type:complete len:484 (-) Transcript_14049:54-1505(-)|eukprot:scaffold34627_cov159-Amphora_coffeaeformis.AAC.8
MPITIDNYDILLEELATGSLRMLSCPHVGNNRLEVLLLMNRNEFEENLTAGNDTGLILDRLINIVTQQCVPPGRFLVADREYDPDSRYEDYEWTEVEIGRARQFLNLALLDSNTANLAGFPTPSPSDPDKAAMPPPQPSAGKGAKDDSKKRFRRSSLLRRSVSESFVRSVQSEAKPSEMGKKKTPNRRQSSFWSIRKQKESDKVTQAEDLDILFNYEQTTLLPNHIGNNRLRVLLNIHKEKYEKSDQNEQTSSLQEWIRTVTQFWGGRFLREEEEDANKFEVLDANQAELALHCVISELSTNGDDIGSLSSSQGKNILPVDKVVPPNLNVQDMRNAAVQSLQKRKKRQGLASRLRRLASGALTRNSSAAAAEPSPSNNNNPTVLPPSSGYGRASSVPIFARGNASGAMSLPTSPTPRDDEVERRPRRSSSIKLPKFLTGRASLRRSQNLAADGVSRDLRASMEATDLELGTDAFGEFPGDENY